MLVMQTCSANGTHIHGICIRGGAAKAEDDAARGEMPLLVDGWVGLVGDVLARFDSTVVVSDASFLFCALLWNRGLFFLFFCTAPSSEAMDSRSRAPAAGAPGAESGGKRVLMGLH